MGLIGGLFIDGLAFVIYSLFSEKYGNLADWFSGLGTVAAFGIVIWQQKTQEQVERAFKIEQVRPRFMWLFRGKLPGNTNVLLNNFDRNYYQILKLIVSFPRTFNLLTLDNISSNTIYLFEVIATYDNHQSVYWMQNGLQRNDIVAPIPEFFVEKVWRALKQKNKLPKLQCEKVKVRFTTPMNETGFYEYDFVKGTENYYFINDMGNDKLQASKDGKIIDKNGEQANKLNEEFNNFKDKRLDLSTIPYNLI